MFFDVALCFRPVNVIKTSWAFLPIKSVARSRHLLAKSLVSEGHESPPLLLETGSRVAKAATRAAIGPAKPTKALATSAAPETYCTTEIPNPPLHSGVFFVESPFFIETDSKLEFRV